LANRTRKIVAKGECPKANGRSKPKSVSSSLNMGVPFALRLLPSFEQEFHESIP
jgi:hypothetical protein